MTKEEKQLFLKVLCELLPYGVICVTTSVYYDGDDNEIGKAQGRLVSINRHRASFVDDRDDTTFGADFEENGQIGFKPCLRPMDSMTEDEVLNLYKMFGFYYLYDLYELTDEWRYFKDTIKENKLFLPYPIWADDLEKGFDYLRSIHIDYRNLIGKGLALPATDGMYN